MGEKRSIDRYCFNWLWLRNVFRGVKLFNKANFLQNVNTVRTAVLLVLPGGWVFPFKGQHSAKSVKHCVEHTRRIHGMKMWFSVSLATFNSSKQVFLTHTIRQSEPCPTGSSRNQRILPPLPGRKEKKKKNGFATAGTQVTPRTNLKGEVKKNPNQQAQDTSHAETLTEIPRHTVQVFTEVILSFLFFFGVS
uniref:Uncharacterized protein n=1 Tax=Anguilla anguilla TaxID=7936 RepID=A0A0E9X6A6_ANGAN